MADPQIIVAVLSGIAGGFSLARAYMRLLSRKMQREERLNPNQLDLNGEKAIIMKRLAVMEDTLTKMAQRMNRDAERVEAIAETVNQLARAGD